MTNEQILKKAIEKAAENGWEVPFRLRKFVELSQSVGNPDIELLFDNAYFGYIFSRDFAKAFAKYLYITGKCSLLNITRVYKTMDKRMDNIKNEFLQQMVLEKEPLKYLEEFLEDNKPEK